MGKVKIAVLDLNKGEDNEEVSSLVKWAKTVYPEALVRVFDLRVKQEFPDLNYHAFLVSGGPGDPRDAEGVFFDMFGQWLDGLMEWNRSHAQKRSALLICHSFQMACLHYGVAQVTERKSPAFGVYPVHLTDAGSSDPVLGPMDIPFYAADFRHFQVVEPREDRLEELDMHILALEKVRPHVPLERAIMAIRFSDQVLGVQFHPEVSPTIMRQYLKDPKRKEWIIRQDGPDKYHKMLRYLNDTSKMSAVYSYLIPAFLRRIDHSA